MVDVGPLLSKIVIVSAAPPSPCRPLLSKTVIVSTATPNPYRPLLSKTVILSTAQSAESKDPGNAFST
jgi:hypothetical protein